MVAYKQALFLGMLPKSPSAFTWVVQKECSEGPVDWAFVELGQGGTGMGTASSASQSHELCVQIASYPCWQSLVSCLTLGLLFQDHRSRLVFFILALPRKA